MKLTIRHPANRMLLCAAVVLALTPIAFSQTASAPAAYIVQQMPIGTVDADVIDPVFSLDGRHMAYVTHSSLCAIRMMGVSSPMSLRPGKSST